MAEKGEIMPDGAGAGGAVVRAARIHVSGEAVRIGAPVPEAFSGEPVVELVRNGDVIQTIEITCPCGERINIRCEYA